jgi:hypothetical protein
VNGCSTGSSKPLPRGGKPDKLLAAFAVEIVGMAAFVALERRHSDPLLDIASIAAYFALSGHYFLLTQ